MSALAAALASVTEPVVAFSYGGCPYCSKLEQVLAAEGIPFAVLDYDGDLGAPTLIPTAHSPPGTVGGCTSSPPPDVAPSTQDPSRVPGVRVVSIGWDGHASLKDVRSLRTTRATSRI